jgi:hypothetical protein
MKQTFIELLLNAKIPVPWNVDRDNECVNETCWLLSVNFWGKGPWG